MNRKKGGISFKNIKKPLIFEISQRDIQAKNFESSLRSNNSVKILTEAQKL
jgi:hypothetical protein